jgi:hypothetical protein
MPTRRGKIGKTAHGSVPLSGEADDYLRLPWQDGETLRLIKGVHLLSTVRASSQPLVLMLRPPIRRSVFELIHKDLSLEFASANRRTVDNLREKWKSLCKSSNSKYARLAKYEFTHCALPDHTHNIDAGPTQTAVLRITCSTPTVPCVSWCQSSCQDRRLAVERSCS